jgi:S-DNA-T family DNA segregation ATPase FtsK/SpoIIIE
MDRRAAQNVPQDAPGRGITKDKLHFLSALPRIDSDQRAGTVATGTADLVARVTAAWSGPPAPPMRLLPREITLTTVSQAAVSTGRSFPLGIAESDLKPVYLDFSADPHFFAFGDVECGKTNLLRTIATGITSRYTAQEAAVLVVDYRRGLLDVVPNDYLLGYAGAEPVLNGLINDVAEGMRRRLPGPDVTSEQLRTRSWWSGPDLFVIVDDYELVATGGRNPLAPLVEFLPQARDIGLHVIVARASGGAGRAMFEAMLQRIRELGSPGIVMSGDKDEGVLIADVKASPQPAGRGTLARRRLGSGLVQVAWTPPVRTGD